MLRTISRIGVRIPFRLFAQETMKLSQIGEGLLEARIIEYYAKEGDTLNEGMPLVKVESDKGVAEISMPYNGKVKQFLHKIDDMCEVGKPLMILEPTDKRATNASTVSNEAKETGKNTKSSHESKTSSPDHNQIAENRSDFADSEESPKVLTTPVIRKFAKDNNIDLSKIRGSGSEGRILKQDLDHYLSGSSTTQTPSHTPTYLGDEVKKVTMSVFEKAMVKTMTVAATVPIFNLYERYDVTKLLQFREEINRGKDKKDKISLMCFFVKAFSLALLKNPKINSLYYPEKNPFEYFLQEDHNISIAIDTSHGLAVPNIKRVQDLSLSQISQVINRLRDLAYSKNLTSKENDKGTVCISNIGTITGNYASPLLMPHQSCIVAIGSVEVAPVWQEFTKSFIPKNMLYVSFAADHRVLDGGTLARFSLTWKKLLENPEQMLMEMR